MLFKASGFIVWFSNRNPSARWLHWWLLNKNFKKINCFYVCSSNKWKIIYPNYFFGAGLNVVSKLETDITWICEPTPPTHTHTQSRNSQPSHMKGHDDHQGFILESKVGHLKVQSVQKPKNEKRTLLPQQIQRVDIQPLLLTPPVSVEEMRVGGHFPPRPDPDRNALASLCSVLHWGASQCEHERKATGPGSAVAADIVHVETPKQSIIKQMNQSSKIRNQYKRNYFFMQCSLPAGVLWCK